MGLGWTSLRLLSIAVAVSLRALQGETYRERVRVGRRSGTCRVVCTVDVITCIYIDDRTPHQSVTRVWCVGVHINAPIMHTTRHTPNYMCFTLKSERSEEY